MDVKKVSQNVWKISQERTATILNLSSNTYLIKNKEIIMIDPGNSVNTKKLLQAIKKICPPDQIKKIIYTHLHYDHTGSPSKCPNATIYASEQSIKDFKKNPLKTTYNPLAVLELKKVKLQPLKKLEGFKIIPTPGHTRGSICLYYVKEKVLFSGDTIFRDGIFGRVDLHNSAPEQMQQSIQKLKKIKYEIVCPGH